MTIRNILRATIPAVALVVAMSAVGAAQAATTKTGKTTLHGYKTLAEAKTACVGDAVVWHATGSKVFHTEKSKYFGKTKHGAYVCEKAALADKLHASKH